MISDKKLTALRQKITEGLRIQRDTADAVSYIDTAQVVGDVCAKQNHTIFARRGCGKTLLLHHSTSKLNGSKTRTVYLNCEDFKRHSFPNVLIEILDALFGELEKHLSGWFGKRKKSRQLIQQIRSDLSKLRTVSDNQEESVRQLNAAEFSAGASTSLGAKGLGAEGRVGGDIGHKRKLETETTFHIRKDKLRELDTWLPRLKEQVREFFQLSSSVSSVFLQIDDLYHLKKRISHLLSIIYIGFAKMCLCISRWPHYGMLLLSILILTGSRLVLKSGMITSQSILTTHSVIFREREIRT